MIAFINLYDLMCTIMICMRRLPLYNKCFSPIPARRPPVRQSITSVRYLTIILLGYSFGSVIRHINRSRRLIAAQYNSSDT